MRHKKQLAARILKISPKKVAFSQDALADIQKAITRSDMRGLIAVGKISVQRKSAQSKARARKIKVQKRKGRQSGRGSKKGSSFATVTRKRRWILRVRKQRAFLHTLRQKQLISIQNYHLLYNKVKGGYFRNTRHIKLYLQDYHLIERASGVVIPPTEPRGEKRP